ncbi:MAG: hypothetical protein Q9219_001810 [cf. Caloplaca sp. 3 TL-2023]
MEKTLYLFPVNRPNFLDLPTEIRWQIYAYLLRPCGQVFIDDWLLASTYEGCSKIARTLFMYRPESARVKSSPSFATYARNLTEERRRYGQHMKIWTNILLVNRKIGHEASDCLYTQNLRFTCSPDAVEAFFMDRSAKVLQFITNITLYVPSETGRTKFMSLCSWIGKELRLKRLTVRINAWMWDEQPWQRIEAVDDSSAEDVLAIDWVQSLLLIRNLDTLQVELDARYLDEKPTGEGFKRVLRERMLKRGEGPKQMEIAVNGQAKLEHTKRSAVDQVWTVGSGPAHANRSFMSRTTPLHALVKGFGVSNLVNGSWPKGVPRFPDDPAAFQRLSQAPKAVTESIRSLQAVKQWDQMQDPADQPALLIGHWICPGNPTFLGSIILLLLKLLLAVVVPRRP